MAERPLGVLGVLGVPDPLAHHLVYSFIPSWLHHCAPPQQRMVGNPSSSGGGSMAYMQRSPGIGKPRNRFPFPDKMWVCAWGRSPKKEYGWQIYSSEGLRACEWEGEKEGILAGQIEGKGTMWLLTNVPSTMMDTFLKTHLGTGESHPSGWPSMSQSHKDQC